MKNIKLVLPIIILDILIVYQILNPFFTDTIDDFLGLFFFIGIFFFILFNVYALMMYDIFKKSAADKKRYYLYFFVLLIPIILTIYVTRPSLP